MMTKTRTYNLWAPAMSGETLTEIATGIVCGDLSAFGVRTEAIAYALKLDPQDQPVVWRLSMWEGTSLLESAEIVWRG